MRLSIVRNSWFSQITIFLLCVFSLVSCGSRETSRKQHIEFEGFTVDEGVYRPKPGWTFTPGKGGTTVVARDNSGGVVIKACECALETGGSCSQAENRDPTTEDIKEIWCVDDKCGFCVGGVSDPDDPSATVRFNVVCLADRKMN